MGILVKAVLNVTKPHFIPDQHQNDKIRFRYVTNKQTNPKTDKPTVIKSNMINPTLDDPIPVCGKLKNNLTVFREVVHGTLDTVECKTLKPSLGKSHSTASRDRTDQKYLSEYRKKQAICWPPLSDDKTWGSFDKLVHSKLDNKGHISSHLNHLQNTIYEEGVSMFGNFSPLKIDKIHVSRVSRKTIELVKEKNNLIDQLELACTEIELRSLAETLAEVRNQFHKLRRSQNTRKRRCK